MYLNEIDENEASYSYLIDANNKSEWLWNFYIKFGLGGFAANFMTSAISSIIFSWYTLKTIAVDRLFHPYSYLWANFSYV